MPLTNQAIMYAALALLGSAPLTGQEPPPPGDVHLTLACAASPCRYRQGEVIPVNLTFRAETMGYEVLTAYPNRFEYGTQEMFTARPGDGVIDPAGGLAAHWISGGSWKIVTVSLDPLSRDGAADIQLELNQWLYFAKPGRYTIQAISNRLLKSGRSMAVTSNPLEMEIITADPEWRRAELGRIMRALPAGLGRLSDAESAAVRALTYMGTEEALAEIRKRTADTEAMDLPWRLAKAYLQLTSSRAVQSSTER